MSEPAAAGLRGRRQALLVGGLTVLALPRAAAQARPGLIAAPAAGVSRLQRAPVFVLNSQDASVSVVDPLTWEERLRIPTGKEPHHLYLTPDERSVIVANAASDSLTFIDPRTAEVQRTLHDVPDPYHLRFSPDMRWLVTAANRLDQIDIYRWLPAQPVPLQLARRLRAPRTPSHLAIDSRSSVVYATLQDRDEIIAIDLATLEPRWKTKVGRMPADLFLTRDDRHLLVGLTGERHVEVHDVSGVQPARVRRLETGAGAHAFRSRGDGRHLFVSNRVANTVSMIDLRDFSVAAQLPGPSGPDCMEMMADGRTLLLTSRWSGRLTVVDVETRQVVRQVRVGRSPHGVWTLDHASRS